MMRFFGKLGLTLGALALLVSPAWAQGRGGFGGGAAGFLMAPNVQKDLKLTDAQVRKVQETLREIRERHQGDGPARRLARRAVGEDGNAERDCQRRGEEGPIVLGRAVKAV